MLTRTARRLRFLSGFLGFAVAVYLLLLPGSTNKVYAVPWPCTSADATGVPEGVCCVFQDLPEKPWITSNSDYCTPGHIMKIEIPDCTCQEVNVAISDLFRTIDGIMLPISIIVGMFIIVLSGYKILTSQGDPTSLQTGKENLTSAIIGLIFVLLSVSILRVIIKALITGDQNPF